MTTQVNSEIGRLEQVVVHRPGDEILRMTHAQLDPFLFDDLLSPDLAGSEHDLLCELLGVHGAEVLEVLHLLQRALTQAPADARSQLIAQVCEQAAVPGLAPALHDWSPEALAHGLIEGILWSEVKGARRSLARVRAEVRDEASIALPPIPNLMFMRDPAIPVFDRVVLSRMATDARSREPLVVRFALQHGLPQPPRWIFDGQDLDRHHAFRQVEGGDFLVLDKRFVAIGCSQRSSAHTIERLAAEALFPAFPELEAVYAVLLPEQRSAMHLDTVCTQIDHGLFLGFTPMVGEGPEAAPVVRLTRRAPPRRVPGASLLDVMREELGEVEMVPCGGDERLHQAREQWTDGANAVCVAPGQIVLYARNVRTIRTLVERYGFVEVALSTVEPEDVRRQRLAATRDTPRVVYTFTGTELSRARGGGRCLTMPLRRG